LREEDTETEPGIATFCAGSFWDLEAAFRHIGGVLSTAVGFMGGTVSAPTYEQVCDGRTGHSEVVMIAYNPGIISFRELLVIFFNSHDPCSSNQGEYTGHQYEPVIYYSGDQDRQLAEEYIRSKCRQDIVRMALLPGPGQPQLFTGQMSATSFFMKRWGAVIQSFSPEILTIMDNYPRSTYGETWQTRFHVIICSPGPA